MIAAQNGAADAAVEAEDLIASQSAGAAALAADLHAASADLLVRAEDIAALRSELESTAETAGMLAARLEEEQRERGEERAGSNAELGHARADVSAHEARAASALERQAALEAEVQARMMGSPEFGLYRPGSRL